MGRLEGRFAAFCVKSAICNYRQLPATTGNFRRQNCRLWRLVAICDEARLAANSGVKTARCDAFVRPPWPGLPPPLKLPPSLKLRRTRRRTRRRGKPGMTQNAHGRLALLPWPPRRPYCAGRGFGPAHPDRKMSKNRRVSALQGLHYHCLMGLQHKKCKIFSAGRKSGDGTSPLKTPVAPLQALIIKPLTRCVTR